MRPYPSNREFDITPFNRQNPPHETLYGLPPDVQYCKKCVISNQRPNSAVEYAHKKDTQKKTIYFDENGVCDACRVAEQKHDEIDWTDRERALRDLCDRFRRKDGSYDCIAPGSGGKDSFYAAHMLKYKYGMHPLTVTWAPHIYTDWGWRNFQSWIHAGLDNFLLTPNGRLHRLLTRLSRSKSISPISTIHVRSEVIGPKNGDCPQNPVSVLWRKRSGIWQSDQGYKFI